MTLPISSGDYRPKKTTFCTPLDIDHQSHNKLPEHEEDARVFLVPAYNTAQEKPHPGFLTTKEAGEVLGITANTVRWHIRSGHLTALRKRWYYGNQTGRNLRVAYFIPIAELKRYGMKKIVEKYARPAGWVRATDDPAAIMEAGE